MARPGGRRKAKPASRGGFWSFWATLPGILTGVAAVLTAIVTIATLLHGFLGGLIGFSPGGGSDTFSLSVSCRATTVTVRATYPARFEGATVFFMFNDVLEDPQQTRNLPDATTFETTFDVARYLASGRHIAVRVNNNEDVTLGSAETDCR